MTREWVTKKLEDVCDIERGGSPRPIDNFLTDAVDGINWIKIGDTKNVTKYIYRTEQKIKPEGAKRSRMVFEGDFILSNSMSFGRPYIMKTTGCIHDGWLVLRKPNVDQDYLYYVLGSDLVFNQFDRLAAGSTVRNLNISLVKGVEIPVPPLSEQRRIVGIIEEVFDGIATAKANAEQNLQNARALFESNLQSVFSLRGDGWVEKRFCEVCEFSQGIQVDVKQQSENKTSDNQVRFLRIVDFTQGNELERYIDNPGNKYLVGESDVSLVRYGATTGFVCCGLEGAIANNLFRVIPKGGYISNEYLYWFLKSPLFQGVVRQLMNGAAMPAISFGMINDIGLPFPPLSLQSELVSQLNVINTETKRLESIYQQKLSALDALKKSLLDQAFTGVL
jgi:type I restriction enzyme S subunit